MTSIAKEKARSEKQNTLRTVSQYGFLIAGILLLASSGFAQTEGGLPQPVESFNVGIPSGCNFNSCVMPEGVNSGDLIVVGAVQPDTAFGSTCGNSNPSWIVSDTIGNTYTAETSAVTPTGGVSQNDYVQLFHTISGSTGANTISINWANDCSGQLFFARFKNISGTTDGLNTATGGPGASPVTATTSNTTTVNGDLLVSFAALNSGPQGGMGVGPALQYLGTKGTLLPEVNAVMGFANAGLAGAQSLSTIRYAGNAAGSSVMQTLAFKPSAMAIVDTVLPHAALSNAYKATIHSIGGAGAITCTITAGTLQTGLSQSGTGNCDITGTPSVASTVSLTFHVTDGTNTANKTLSLTVDNSFNTPTVVSTLTGNFDSSGGSATPVLADCGDLIVLQLATGADTHGSTGWIQTQNGANSFYSDSFGSPVTFVPGIGGIISGGVYTYLFGPVTQSGFDTITGRQGLTGSAALEYQISVVRGVQGIADYGSFNNNVTSGSGTTTLTTTFTAPVSNELLLSSTLDENTGSTISLGAPFSISNSGQDGFNAYAFGVATGVSAGSVSNVASITSGQFHTQSTSLLGLRPGFPSGCSVNAGAGEKIHHQVF